MEHDERQAGWHTLGIISLSRSDIFLLRNMEGKHPGGRIVAHALVEQFVMQGLLISLNDVDRKQ